MRANHPSQPRQTACLPYPHPPPSPIFHINDGEIRAHLTELVRGSVEETLNTLLDTEADALCGAKRYERHPERTDYRAGHYERGLETKAGPVTLQVPKLRKATFETAIIDRYRRREASVEEALIEMYMVVIYSLVEFGLPESQCRGAPEERHT